MHELGIKEGHQGALKGTNLTQSFFSLVFWIALVNLKRGISLVTLVFSLSFPRILWAPHGQKILDNLEVVPDKNPKAKEKKDREGDKPSPNADFRSFLQILTFSQKTKHLGNADFRRKPVISAGNCRKPQEPAEKLAFIP